MSSVLNVEDSPSVNVSPAVAAVLGGRPGAEHATIQSAEFRTMVRSRLNVRRKSSNVGELAALIRAQGILQNLIGFAQVVDGEPTGMVEIVAGGRRLAAVGALIAQGELPEDYRIPFLCVTEEEAVEISLAENLGREDMHPADVLEAMLSLSERGRSIDDIALSFHLDVLTVRRRLKLANVSPRLLALYRNDEANFEQMMALAITDDHAAQEQAWDSLGKHHRHAHELRRLLTAQQVSVQDDRVARFVGAAAFEKAGGIITRDLFSNSGGGYISDAPLLERLAVEKLAKERLKLAKEGHAWIDVLPRADHATLSEYGRVRTTQRRPSEEQLAELASLRGQREALEEQRESSGDDEAHLRELDGQIEQVQNRCREIQRSFSAVPVAEDQSLAGAVISLDEGGKVVIRRDLIRPTDKAKMVKMAAADGEGPVRHKGVHSDRLTRILTSHRTAALQVEMSDRPDVALAVLTHTLVIGLVMPQAREGRCARVSLTVAGLAEEAVQGEAGRAMEAKRLALRERLGAAVSEDGLLAWLLGQPQSVVLELLAFCVASSLDTVQEREGDCAGFIQLARALDLDMKKWWKPTAANYFHHVSKERALAVVGEAVSKAAAVPLEKMKKAAAAEAAERALAELAWLPEPLRVR